MGMSGIYEWYYFVFIINEEVLFISVEYFVLLVERVFK